MKRDIFYTEGDLTLVRVSGNEIRSSLDIEFTNLHPYWDKPYIPRGEIWVSNFDSSAEVFSWFHRIKAEKSLLLDGESWHQAYKQALRAEREYRQWDPRFQIEDPCRDVITYRDGMKVVRVRGEIVRTRYYLDFSLGGNHLRYHFIPPDEIWLEENLEEAEIPLILEHELVEVRHMKQGMDYNTAHQEANFAELVLRKR